MLYDDLIAAFSGTNTGAINALPPAQRAPLSINAIGGALDAYGSAVGAASHLQFGIQARQAANYEAAQLNMAAGQAQAGSQRDAFSIDRQTQMVTSRALAVAAASGGGASDPTVVNIMARDAAQGAYEKAVALYQGNDRARLLQSQAEAKLYEGKTTFMNSAEVAGDQTINGASNLLRSQARGASLYSRFAGNGPSYPDVGNGWG